MINSLSMPSLKHTCFNSASILYSPPCSLTEMTYGERLLEAITSSGASRSQLADAIGKSVQAVGQVILGKSSAFTAENHARAARFLKVDAFWLATGEGSSSEADEWPFPEISREDIEKLTDSQKEQLQGAVLILMIRFAGQKPLKIKDIKPFRPAVKRDINKKGAA